MQKLALPFRECMYVCGYKTAAYRRDWGYDHFGIDISARNVDYPQIGDYNIYASGEGTVVAAGQDPKLGYGLAILYKACYNRSTGTYMDVIARYVHCPKVYVKVGDRVHRGDLIAVEGKEGTGGYHLHLEFDVDTDYPTYTPQVAWRARAFWKKGTDSTINPSYLLNRYPEQILATPKWPHYLNEEDMNIPNVEKVEQDRTADLIKDIKAILKKYEGE